MPGNASQTRIAVACQGGGAHAAFAAEVLKSILRKIRDEREYEIIALSGTSGGAICAYLAWYALLSGDKEQEDIRLLESFWQEDNVARLPGEAWYANYFLQTLGQWWGLADLTMPWKSPYRIFDSPLLHGPGYWQEQLRVMIERKVNKKKVEKRVKLAEDRTVRGGLVPVLYIGAANPRTGEFHVFRSHKPDPEQGGNGHMVFNRSPSDGICVEAVLASAAIPSLFKAVHTGKAVYPCSRQGGQRPTAGAAAYWDGLYSSNPPIRELADLKPDEIWVIQINPEEIDNLPKDTANTEDRRNELAGNLSLNQELAFVRRTNEMVRRFGAYEDGKLKLVDRSRANEKEYRVIKVRRIEVDRFLPLDYLSKLDRSFPNIRRLTEHGNSQAEHFLKALSILNTFQTAWDEALQAWAEARRASQGGEEKLNAVADDVAKTFTSEAKIRLVPPHGSRSCERCYKGKQIQERVKWCLSKNFNLEQARDYHVEGDKVSWWMLVTADHLHTPMKFRTEVVVKEGKIARFTLYPLDIETVEELEAVDHKEHQRGG
jgi:NTE family protein